MAQLKDARAECKAQEPTYDAEVVVDAAEALVEQPKPKSRSIVPLKYKERYGAASNCGDAVAQAFAEAAPRDGDQPTELRKIAEANAVDFSRWAHCNIGQQRMNLSNVLRGMLRKGKDVQIGSHRLQELGGYRLVKRESPGGNIYMLPEEFAEMSISDCIRRLASVGWSRWEIHQVTGIRYQHVRNVLEQEATKSKLKQEVTDETDSNVTDLNISCSPTTLAGQPQTIADVLNVARSEIAALAGVAEDMVKLDLHIGA